jgi:hypothetical protein
MTIKPEVLAAIDRMCTPLDEARLGGMTAQCDARCMALIRAELLAMDARLAEANALLLKIVTPYYDAVERVQLFKDIQTHLSEPRS